MPDFDKNNALGISTASPQDRALDSLFGGATQQRDEAVDNLFQIDRRRRARDRAVETVEVSRDTNPDEAAKNDHLSRS